MHKFFTADYILDGVTVSTTPLENFADSLSFDAGDAGSKAFSYIDESVDPLPTPDTFVSEKLEDYIRVIENADDFFPIGYERFAARGTIAAALLDCLWKKGHFALGDLRLALDWKWNPGTVGNMAAFYRGSASAAEFISDMGLKITALDASETDAGCRFCAEVSGADEGDDIFDELSDGTPVSLDSSHRIVSEKAAPDLSSWLFFIPFDCCRARLGGSAFSLIAGNGMQGAPDVADTDYFRDCYEVLREMAEDGVLRSGVSVGKGGLACAAFRLMDGTGMCLPLDLSGMKASYDVALSTLLFSEVPGVLVQIADQDYDYADSQFLLQDIAFYPVGRPVEAGPDGRCVRLSPLERADVGKMLGGILEALTPEGED